MRDDIFLDYCHYDVANVFQSFEFSSINFYCEIFNKICVYYEFSLPEVNGKR